MTHVAVAIPSIAKRSHFLQRAVESAENQQVADDVKVTTHVHLDDPRTGASNARNQALRMALDADPEWIVFLDDDDELNPDYITHCLGLAAEHSRTLVYGWYEVIGGGDPFPVEQRTAPMDISNPHIIPISYMVAARHARHALDTMGGFQEDEELPRVGWMKQDWPIIEAMMKDGAEPYGSGHVCWKWHHQGCNTGGWRKQNA